MGYNNPFFHRGPIRDAHYFWNRNREVERASFLISKGQCVSVVGPRRMGKTSLLHQLSSSLLPAGDGAQLRPVFFDSEGWSRQSRRALYGALLNAIRQALGDDGGDPHRDPAAITYGVFSDEIRRMTAPGERLVLFLDEFDALSLNPHLDADFFSGLRALATNDLVTFVTSSTQSLGLLTFGETSALSSPFFNIFSQVTLRPFSMEDATQMLVRFASMGGASFDEPLLAFLLSLAGPHPFFLQIAGFYAYERIMDADDQLTDADYDWVRREFVSQSEPHWRYAWRLLSPTQRRLLSAYNHAGPSDASNLRELFDGGLLVERDGRYGLLSSALADFVTCRPVDGLIQAPPVTIDQAQRRVLVQGRALALNRLEFELLALLAQDTGRCHPFAAIESRLWPEDDARVNDSERLKGVIKSLRRRLGEHAFLIENVRGVGYRYAGRSSLVL